MMHSTTLFITRICCNDATRSSVKLKNWHTMFTLSIFISSSPSLPLSSISSWKVVIGMSFLLSAFFPKLILMGIQLIDSWLPFLRINLTFRQPSLYGWLAGEKCALPYCLRLKKKNTSFDKTGILCGNTGRESFRKDLSLDISPVEKGHKAVEQLAPSACLHLHRTSLVSINMFAGY